ncbi:NADP-dependent oxidoreductase [Nocardia yamanashiensis]|uniref:NADP-dependent oxidoreductase n=1 Tax=Nocardia yamanashiensis TaxID=209247 RepID=UPI001E287114|nr:NADP-dependent oxidoreductase [Nocardia yamanashiensis]UGT40779.1 NADP-dependent oxidoreductase [Nocardia yamanashiensis]
MRAIVVNEFGGPIQPSEMPKPQAGPGQIQIALEAAGVNPFDKKLIDGFLDGKVPYEFPMIPGVDGAGKVSGVGDGVTGFRVGDRVVGKFLVPPIGHGTWAEYIVVPEASTVAAVPDAVTAVQAAALPTAAITALDLVDAAGIVAGQSVLIVGAAGGVGSFLVQLVAAAGGNVIATARPDDTDRMIRLGAAEVVNYGVRVPASDSPEPARYEATIADQVRATHPGGVDVLFDLVDGPDQLRELTMLVREGGALYSTVWAADDTLLQSRRISGGNFESGGGAAQLARLLDLAAKGELVIPIDATPPLAEAGKVVGAPGARGKTVLVI